MRGCKTAFPLAGKDKRDAVRLVITAQEVVERERQEVSQERSRSNIGSSLARPVVYLMLAWRELVSGHGGDGDGPQLPTGNSSKAGFIAGLLTAPGITGDANLCLFRTSGAIWRNTMLWIVFLNDPLPRFAFYLIFLFPIIILAYSST